MRKKKKKISEQEEKIIIYLKKNRKFSRTIQLELEEEKYLTYIFDKLESLKDINYIIFQDKIYRNHQERFLYTEDTYVFILNNKNLFNIIKDLSFDEYKYKGVLCIEDGELEHLIK